MTKNVLTIATGKKFYVDMAANLARSFQLWNKATPIKFYLATDLSHYLPHDVKEYTTVIELEPGQFGSGFSPKMHLDQIAPNGETLFIDSDCLIYGDLMPVFRQFKGHNVSVVGGFIAEGDWYGDIGKILKKYGLEKMPKFNGGVYYIETSPAAAQVYETARELISRYDEIGFEKFRNRIADEPVMALALALNRQQPIEDDGTIMSDQQACPGVFISNVISGKAILKNPPYPDPLHQSWYPFEKVAPVIVHFLGQYNAGYQYKKEAYRLKKYSESKLNFLSEANAVILIEARGKLIVFLKNKLRNIYHALFGVRQIKKSERL